jgi:type I restriction-modification system DNA methylase subunit
MAKEKSKKSISKLIEEILVVHPSRRNKKQVFDDLIQLTFNTVFSAALQKHPLFKTEYTVHTSLINELTDYKNNAKAWELLIEASQNFMELFVDSEPFTDVLGLMYDEYLGETLGQFFSPSDVARVVAELSFAVADKPPKSISDTCGCGSGSLILGQLATIYKKYGAEALSNIEVVGMDIDIRMVQLTSIQIVFSAMVHKLPIQSLEMHHGNTLTDWGKETGVIRWVPNPQINALNKIMAKLED